VAIHSSGVGSGIAIILILLLSCPNTLAQTSTAFDPANKFSVPSYNGVISFAVNGTYSSATFANNTWIFTNLRLNQSETMASLEISTSNSNVTVIYYGVNAFFPSNQLSYFAQGQGQQFINMGLGSSAGRSVDWVVFSNDTFVTNGWSVSHDGTVTVTGLTGNVSVIYFGFTNELGNNLPFYEQHSVAIAVGVGVVVTVAFAVGVNIVFKRRSAKETNQVA